MTEHELLALRKHFNESVKEFWRANGFGPLEMKFVDAIGFAVVETVVKYDKLKKGLG
jgi:hypothetical protein